MNSIIDHQLDHPPQPKPIIISNEERNVFKVRRSLSIAKRLDYAVAYYKELLKIALKNAGTTRN